MTRYVYGHDYKPPSNFVRNLLVAVIAAIAVFTLVWKTHDPRTLSLMSGVKPAAAEKIRLAPEPPRIDAKQQGGSRDKNARRND